MASYVITAEGPWPVNDLSPREPLAGEMFAVTRDGEPARPVIAHVPHGSLVALQADLERDGLDRDTAKQRALAVFRHLGAEATRAFALAGSLRHPVDDQALAVFRHLGAEATRAFALAGSLRHRVDDQALAVPVELDGPNARRLGRTPGLPLYQRGDQAGEPFEVDD